jgi:hypothetical protein
MPKMKANDSVPSDSSGVCLYCGQSVKYHKRSLVSHLVKNDKILDESGDGHSLLLVKSMSSEHYWMCVLAKDTAKLSNLDRLLREVWLECCGHLSEFRSKTAEIAMNRTIDAAFTDNPKLSYTYDFGTSSELSIERIANGHSDEATAITIAVRNANPVIPCSFCGRPSTQCCSVCWDDDKYLCADCAPKHPCVETEGEEVVLPLVNSPRSGLCGYDGPDIQRVAKYLPHTPRPKTA